MDRRRILVIAGSDSSGGAGLEADQKVIAAHGCYAMTATTALTAQNTQGVYAIHHVPSDFVVQQIDACVTDIGVDVVKIGMLASAETVDAVSKALQKHGNPAIVVDPVMISTSGAQLLPDIAVHNLRLHLLPLTTVLTPNIPEASLLLESAGLEAPKIESLVDIINMAKVVQRLGPRYVLIKGGHLPLTRDGRISRREVKRQAIIDVLYDGTEAILFQTDYSPSKNTHGTGCSLASAIACGIALGPDLANDIPSAVEMAVRYVEAGIKAGIDLQLGHGSGPINHFHSLSMRLSPPFESSMQRSIYQGKGFPSGMSSGADVNS